MLGLIFNVQLSTGKHGSGALCTSTFQPSSQQPAWRSYDRAATWFLVSIECRPLSSLFFRPMSTSACQPRGLPCLYAHKLMAVFPVYTLRKSHLIYNMVTAAAGRIRASLLALGIFLAAALKLTFSVWFWVLSYLISRSTKAGELFRPILQKTMLHCTTHHKALRNHPRLAKVKFKISDIDSRDLRVSPTECDPQVQASQEQIGNCQPQDSSSADDSVSGDNSTSLLLPSSPQCPTLIDASDPSAFSPDLPDSPETPTHCDTFPPFHSRSLIEAAETLSWHTISEPDIESGLGYNHPDTPPLGIRSASSLELCGKTPTKLNVTILGNSTSLSPGSVLSRVAACIHPSSHASQSSNPLPQFHQEYLVGHTGVQVDACCVDNASGIFSNAPCPLPSFTLIPPNADFDNPILLDIAEPSDSSLIPFSSALPSLPTSPFLALPPHAPTPCNSPHRAGSEFLNQVTPSPFKKEVLTEVLGDGIKMYRPTNTGLRPLLLPKEVAKRNPQEVIFNLAPVRNTGFHPKPLMLPQKVARNSVDFDALVQKDPQDKLLKASKRFSANVEAILCKRPQPVRLAASSSLPFIKFSLSEESTQRSISENVVEEQSVLMSDIFQLLESSQADDDSDISASDHDRDASPDHTQQMQEILALLDFP